MSRNWAQFYTSFKGRATRFDFNVPYALVMFLGSVVAGIADYAIAGGDVMVAAQSTPVSTFWNFLVIWPTFAISARRLHDMNLSGWWQLVAYGVMVGAVVWIMSSGVMADPLAVDLSRMAMPLASIVTVFFVFFVGLSCIRGTKGPNKYGEDPLTGVK